MTREAGELAAAIMASPALEDLIRAIKARGTFRNGQVYMAPYVEHRAAGYREALDDLRRLIEEVSTWDPPESGSQAADPFDTDDIAAARFGRNRN